METNSEDITEPQEVAPQVEEISRSTALRQAVIAVNDQRFPLLEMESSDCSVPLSADDEDALSLMNDVMEELNDEAAGLAAVQIGYPKRIFILRKDGENVAYINPSIVAVSSSAKKDFEACLSIPGGVVRTARPKWVTLQFINIDGRVETETFSGFWARAVMHEMDHLNGTLIVKYLEKEISKRVNTTSFGMKVTPAKINQIARRRAKNRRAKMARRTNR